MTIEQDSMLDLEVAECIGSLILSQGHDDFGFDRIVVNKQGAKQLIKVLQEFVGKDKDAESEALRLNNLG